jgi:hypothetical protein
MAVLQGRTWPALGIACNCKCVKHLLLLQRGAVHPMRMPIDAQRIKHASMQLNAIINARSTCYQPALTQFPAQIAASPPALHPAFLAALSILYS